MDVRLSQEQQLLEGSAADFLEAECPMSLVREQLAPDAAFPEALWKQMAELGWLGLAVPEASGGSGLGLVDLALLMEAQGRVLCPAPFLSTAVVGSTALMLGEAEALAEAMLPRLARGELRTAFAQLERANDWSGAGVELCARSEGGHVILDGHKRFVADAGWADALVVVARDAGGAPGSEGISLYWVPIESPGLQLRPIAYNEMIRKLYQVDLEGVRVPTSHRLGGWSLAERIHARARAALCAELAGGARRALELSVAYVSTREQFGRPIGGFQAVSHKCADMLVKVEGMKSVSYYAAWALDAEESDAHVSACLAKSFCGDAYSAIAGDAIQVHGGLGFTWEQDPHLYFKHAQAGALAWGDGVHVRELAARALLD